ncbi:MAG TPA: hypothetical protein DCR14_18765 [Acidimicrobiaceae bacterium]|nr:hypothetical protein [Acidimicrobiaceae bacterium]
MTPVATDLDFRQFRLAVGDERTLPNGRVEGTTIADWQRVLEASRSLAISVNLTPVGSGRPAPAAATDLFPSDGELVTVSVLLPGPVQVNLFPYAVSSIDFDFDTAEIVDQDSLDRLAEFVRAVASACELPVVLTHEGADELPLARYDPADDSFRLFGTRLFVDTQVVSIESLVGRRVASWAAVEMALDDPSHAEPTFADPAELCVQALALDVRFEDGASCRFVTYQSDEAWGLELRADAAAPDEPVSWAGIYRQREINEFPHGLVEGAEVLVASWGDLIEARLAIDGREVLLIAGELDLLPSGVLVATWGDESVLGFTDPNNAERLPWRPSREVWR